MVNDLKLIKEGDEPVAKVIGPKPAEPGKVYRWSDFAFLQRFEGKDYLYNNFTKRIYRLDGENLEVNSEKRYSYEEIIGDDALKTLADDSFLVPQDKNESEVYVGYCKIARMMKMRDRGFSSFVVLPTTACNARCIYCYEQGIEYVTMNDETVAQTVEFIKKARDPKKKVNFIWFGGEPLVGERFIDRICAELSKADIPFSSIMISNGSLITESNLKKIKDDWKVHYIQITLDGVEEEYNRRKNYYFDYASAYWHVLSRIKLINESGIRLNIRVNVDEGNIDGVMEMMQDVKNFIVDPGLITFDLAPLFDLQSGDSCIPIWDKTFRISEEIMRMGFHINAHYKTKKAKYHHCMADTPYRSIVIAPDGKLYHCEHIGALECAGDIWNGVTNLEQQKSLNMVEPVSEKCQGCFSLPQCTTFSRCTQSKLDCRYVARKRMERAVVRQLRNIKNHSESLENAEDTDNETDDC